MLPGVCVSAAGSPVVGSSGSAVTRPIRDCDTGGRGNGEEASSDWRVCKLVKMKTFGPDIALLLLLVSFSFKNSGTRLI